MLVEKSDYRGFETSTNQNGQTRPSAKHHASEHASPMLFAKVFCIVQSAVSTDRSVFSKEPRAAQLNSDTQKHQSSEGQMHTITRRPRLPPRRIHLLIAIAYHHPKKPVATYYALFTRLRLPDPPLTNSIKLGPLTLARVTESCHSTPPPPWVHGGTLL